METLKASRSVSKEKKINKRNTNKRSKTKKHPLKLTNLKLPVSRSQNSSPEGIPKEKKTKETLVTF